jgi:hypothetical protein
MSFESWNPQEETGRTYDDQMIYGQRYYDWVITDKYRQNKMYPTSARGYPRMRNNLELRRAADVYRYKELAPNGSARIHKKWNYNDSTSLNYLREVFPPNYYEMYGY